MDRRIKLELGSIDDFVGLRQFEEYARRMIQKTGLDLSALTPVEERIFDAIIEYIRLTKLRKKRPPTRTLPHLGKYGFIEHVERFVEKRRISQLLEDENRQDISYEQIVLDYPEEFSQLAMWRAQCTLGRPNVSKKPPVRVDTLERIAALEEKYLNRSLEEKIRVSKVIERGPIGARVKKEAGYKCQLCNPMGWDPPFEFRKKNGNPYIEAHHVMPVSTKQVGVLAASNIMALCANHHRQMHYGVVTVLLLKKSFRITIEDRVLDVKKTKLLAWKS